MSSSFGRSNRFGIPILVSVQCLNGPHTVDCIYMPVLVSKRGVGKEIRKTPGRVATQKISAIAGAINLP